MKVKEGPMNDQCRNEAESLKSTPVNLSGIRKFLNFAVVIFKQRDGISEPVVVLPMKM